MSLITEETVVETSGDDMVPQPGPKRKLPGLAGRDFSALFRGDREPRAIEFTVGGGEKECFVKLLPLDKDQLSEVARMASRSSGAITTDPAILDYVIGCTLMDFSLWHRPQLAKGGRGAWQMIRPAQGKGAILQQVKSDFKALPEFWEGLVIECLRENNLMGEETEEGNSPLPSES